MLFIPERKLSCSAWIMYYICLVVILTESVAVNLCGIQDLEDLSDSGKLVRKYEYPW